MSDTNFSSEARVPASSWSRYCLNKVANIGAYARSHWDELRHSAAVIGPVLRVAAGPRYWARPMRTLFARQVKDVGVEPLGFVCALAAFVGISIVVQLSFWTGQAGQSELLGPLLVAVVARELGPLLINIVIIVRSGSAMTTELGVLKIGGEVKAMEGQGQDPFLHLVVPRVLGVAISTFCLTIVFILVALASGYLFASWTGKGSRDFLLFADTVSKAIHPKDVLVILTKSILPALFAGATYCIGGLGIRGAVTEIPGATQRALTRSVAGLFAISAVVSLLTYL